MMSDPVVLEDWEAVLKAETPPDRQRRYREAIVKFRYWLREKGKEPVPDAFKEHLAWKQSYLPSERFEIRREALRWYYMTGLKRMQERAVSSGVTGTGKAEVQGKVSGDGARFDEAAQAKPPEAQKWEAGRQTTAPTPAGRDARGAGTNPVPPSGRPSAQVAQMGGYRVYGMNDVPKVHSPAIDGFLSQARTTNGRTGYTAGACAFRSWRITRTAGAHVAKCRPKTITPMILFVLISARQQVILPTWISLGLWGISPRGRDWTE